MLMFFFFFDKYHVNVFFGHKYYVNVFLLDKYYVNVIITEWMNGLFVFSMAVTTVDSGSKALEFLGLCENDETNPNTPSVFPNNHQV